jgi:UDP-N-acetyl-D-glucosamine dehydrogenase
VAAADAVIVLVAHDDFDLDALAPHARYVLDTQHRIDGPNVEHL